MKKKIIIFLIVILCILIGCKKKYYDSNGNRVLNGFVDIEDIGTCFIDEKGEIVKNCIKNINDKLYCFDENGKLQIGTFGYEDNTYRTQEDGAIIRNSIIGSIFVENDGKISKATGWKDVMGYFGNTNPDGSWKGQYFDKPKKTYLFNQDNETEAVKASDVGGRGADIEYYLSMYDSRNEVLLIDNQKCVFDEKYCLVEDKYNYLKKKCVYEYNDNTSIEDMDGVYLGSYRQSSNDYEKTPIEWVKLTDGKLISKYILDNININDINGSREYRDHITKVMFDEEMRNFVSYLEFPQCKMGAYSSDFDIKYRCREGYIYSPGVKQSSSEDVNLRKIKTIPTDYAKSVGADGSYLLGNGMKVEIRKFNKQEFIKNHLCVNQDGNIVNSGSETEGFRPIINIDIPKYIEYLNKTGEVKVKIASRSNMNVSIAENIKKVKTLKEMPEDCDFNQFETVTFGKFPQTDIYGIEADDLEWVVLDKDTDTALLMSKYILNYDNMKGTTLVAGLPDKAREWLNNDFYNSAFSTNEKRFLQPCNHEGVNTTDFVDLPNINDIKKYLTENNTSKKLSSDATKYVVNKNKTSPMYSLSNFEFEKLPNDSNAYWINSYVKDSYHESEWKLNEEMREYAGGDIWYRPIIRVSLANVEAKE